MSLKNNKIKKEQRHTRRNERWSVCLASWRNGRRQYRYVRGRHKSDASVRRGGRGPAIVQILKQKFSFFKITRRERAQLTFHNRDCVADADAELVLVSRLKRVQHRSSLLVFDMKLLLRSLALHGIESRALLLCLQHSDEKLKQNLLSFGRIAGPKHGRHPQQRHFGTMLLYKKKKKKTTTA